MFLTLQLRGGGGATTEVKLGGTIIFDGHVGTVGELKEILFEQLGIFPHQQDLGHPNGMASPSPTFNASLESPTRTRQLNLV